MIGVLLLITAHKYNVLQLLW